MGKRFISIVFLFAILITPFYGLSNQLYLSQGSNQARKFDEYSKCRRGVANCIEAEDEWARLDNLGNFLRDDLSLQAYIIAYTGRNDLRGAGLRHANYVRNLVRRWVADDSRVRVLDGGRREYLTIELWLVPSGAFPPTPTPTTSLEQASNNITWKYDEYSHPYIDKTSVEMFSEYEYYNQSAVLDGFALLLEKEPNLQAYIISYDGPRDRSGTAYELAERDKFYLISESNIDPSKITIMKGGRRKARVVELWVMPPGASTPKPTATTIEKRAKRR